MKPAEILHVDASLVDNAVSLWKAGQLVGIPTETVYGLAADATNGEAVARIYGAKSRPQFNPLIVHVANIQMATRYVEWDERAELLAKDYWPGPLTLVLKRRADSPISDLVSAGGDTIGIRCPQHPVAHQLISAFDGGLAAPSANRSGRVSPTTAQHVRDEFPDLFVIDGGPCRHGIESTVLDLSTNRATILRPGSVTLDMIRYVLRGHAPRAEVYTAGQGDGVLKSPGQLESHYAPSIPVRLNATHAEPTEALLAFGRAPKQGSAAILNLSVKGDLIEAAANLFAMMRALDKPDFTAIAVMPIPNEGVGIAINDRLKRAAA